MTNATGPAIAAAQGSPAAAARRTVLLVDDEPDYPQLVLVPALSQDCTVVLVATAAQALAALQARATPFDLVILDLMLDERMPEALAESAEAVSEALRHKGLSSQYSAQALGLWLWQHRGTRRQPYCYLSSYPEAHVANLGLDGNDKEFQGATAAELKELVCRRGDEGAGSQLVGKVLGIWTTRQW